MAPWAIEVVPPGRVVTTMNCVPLVVAVEIFGMVVMILAAPGVPVTLALGAAMTMVCFPPAPCVTVAMPGLATFTILDGSVLMIVDTGRPGVD